MVFLSGRSLSRPTQNLKPLFRLAVDMGGVAHYSHVLPASLEAIPQQC